MLIAAIALAFIVVGGCIFYAGMRAGANLQWSASHDEEPFTKPKTFKVAETD